MGSSSEERSRLEELGSEVAQLRERMSEVDRAVTALTDTGTCTCTCSRCIYMYILALVECTSNDNMSILSPMLTCSRFIHIPLIRGLSLTMCMCIDVRVYVHVHVVFCSVYYADVP